MGVTRRKDETDLEWAERRLSEIERTSEDRRNEIKRLKRRAGQAEKDLVKSQELLGKVAELRQTDLKVPTWVGKLPKSKAAREHTVRPLLLLSDLHLDEVVDPDTMDGYNAYDREIAQQRLERVIESTIHWLRTYTANLSYDGITVALGGDILTGVIHDELTRTNAAPLPDTIAFWTPFLASLLEHLADEFGMVHVPSVDGNHDRMMKRMEHKNRAKMSWWWVMAAWLADHFRDDDRIHFTHSESSELMIPVFDTNILMVHGDGAKGGGGIGGIWPPITRYVHKVQSVYTAQGRPFDFAIMGHWHQHAIGANFIVNGSTKGYDEYAKANAFPYAKPSQTLMLISPERGRTAVTEIFAE
jgi:hypothetical protein